MKTSIRSIGAVVLCSIGFTALYLGWGLMIDPSGELLHVPLRETTQSIFQEYFILGAILFFVLGWGSLLILPRVIRGTGKTTALIILIGMTLSAWTVVQVMSQWTFVWLHLFYLAISMLIIFLAMNYVIRNRNTARK